MANVGHKAVLCDHLAELHGRLGHPKATGRRLFGLAAWLAATPEDTFWARRAAKRLVGAEVAVPCLRHRLLLNFEGESEGLDTDVLVREAAEAALRSLRGR